MVKLFRWCVVKLLNVIRKINNVGDSEWYRGHLNIISNVEMNKYISYNIKNGSPFMVARLGSVEIKPLLFYHILNNLNFFEKCKLYVAGDIDNIFIEHAYEKYMTNILCNNAGFFPNKPELLNKFANLYLSDIKEIDLCGAWLNEYLLLDYFSENIMFCNLGDLEPYDYVQPWSTALKGKNVLVVHPFADTIEKQYNNRELLWSNKNVLPEFNLKTIKAVQSIAGEKTQFNDWFEALNHMEQQMDSVDYDIALIGCGAYGLPLAAYAKRKGKQAIHLGGPLQILFGIKGKRWDNMPAVNKFYNNYWVYPSAEETPKNNANVEGGCYW